MSATGSLLDALECRACCAESDPDVPHGVCPVCGQALSARYDLARFEGGVWWSGLANRPPSIWRYRELLPVRDSTHVTTLGERATPVVALGVVPEAPGCEVLMKDDGGLPTGSFKSRGMAIAVSRAKELGLRELYAPSAGNAGLALAAYGARAGLRIRVYLPERTPEPYGAGPALYGAEVIREGRTIREAGEGARRRERGRGSFDLSTLREPYRVEGKKTMGFEIVEELGPSRLPDSIIYPAGGGTGLVGCSRRS